jgi:cytochrome c oxidase subunit 2
MRISGLKLMIAAAGLTLASLGGLSAAAMPRGSAMPANSTAPAVADLAFSNSTQPTTAAAPATALPTDPMLAQDGAPAMSPTEHIGQPSNGRFGIQPQVTKNGRDAHWFHDAILVPLIVVISLFVLALLFWVAYRYRAAKNPVPSKTSHNTMIEIVWTLAPVIILVAIAVPSIRLLAAQFKPAPANAITLKATGNQWYWTYEYPDLGGIQITANILKEKNEVGPGQRYRTDVDGPRLLAADNRVVLPVGVPIRLITTGADVIHSWAVPAFWIKLDAVPGRLNETSFTIEKPGVYFGQCSELCGARHAYMPIAVEAVPPAQFAAWVRAKGGTMPGQARAANGPAAALAAGAATAAPPGEFAPAPDNATNPAVVNGTAPINERATGNTGPLSTPSGN